MFDVSNEIAYGGTLMVYGTAPRPAFPGRNQWVDVPTTQSLGNWVPAEGAELERLLRELADAGVEADDVRVISPFRAVIRGCRGVARSVIGPRFAGKNVGTVHTVQGREADVVVLVLGSAADAARARRWAAEKPNLLNVAVSRARRRFYVIGDRSRWEDLRYFDVLAGALRL
jgi:superfamily I DNA and/or RNA helicase